MWLESSDCFSLKGCLGRQSCDQVTGRSGRCLRTPKGTSSHLSEERRVGDIYQTFDVLHLSQALMQGGCSADVRGRERDLRFRCTHSFVGTLQPQTVPTLRGDIQDVLKIVRASAGMPPRWWVVVRRGGGRESTHIRVGGRGGGTCTMTQ